MTYTALKSNTNLPIYWGMKIWNVVCGTTVKWTADRSEKAKEMHKNRVAPRIVRSADYWSSPVRTGLLAGVGGVDQESYEAKENYSKALSRHMTGVLMKVSEGSVRFAGAELSASQRRAIVLRRAMMLKALHMAKLAGASTQQISVNLAEPTKKSSPVAGAKALLADVR